MSILCHRGVFLYILCFEKLFLTIPKYLKPVFPEHSFKNRVAAVQENQSPKSYLCFRLLIPPFLEQIISKQSTLRKEKTLVAFEEKKNILLSITAASGKW